MVKNLPANAGDIRDAGLIPRVGGSPGEGNGNSLQDSCLENPMDRGPWWATVHKVTKELDTTEHTHVYEHFSLASGTDSEKEMATHSSVLAWTIPGMGEPGGLLSMGSRRVGHD